MIMEPEIPSQGIKDLYKANLEAGRTRITDNLLIRFPSLKDETIETDSKDKEAEEEEQPEVKPNGKKPKGRAK